MTRNSAKGNIIIIKIHHAATSGHARVDSPPFNTCKACTDLEVSTLACDIKNYFVNFKVHTSLS